MKPQNITQTIRKLMHYMGNHALLFVLVGILVALSALGNLLGTYMIRPVVNEVLSTGLDKAFLQILLMAFIFDWCFIRFRLYTDHGSRRPKSGQRYSKRFISCTAKTAIVLL